MTQQPTPLGADDHHRDDTIEDGGGTPAHQHVDPIEHPDGDESVSQLEDDFDADPATDPRVIRGAIAAAVVLTLITVLLFWRPWADKIVDEPTQAAPTPTATPTATTKNGHPIETVAARPNLMLAKNNVFVQDVTKAPVAKNSSAMMTKMYTEQIKPYFAGVAAFNAYEYTASFWVADAKTKRVTMKFDNCQGKKGTPHGLYDGPKVFMNVPIPDNAVPASGTDQQLAIWSPSLDKLWEFWVAGKDKNGNWQACWGGRIDNVSTAKGYFHPPYGAAATGLAFVGSMVSVEEAKSLQINHAVGLNLINPANWDNFSYPAQRSDGYQSDKNLIPEGSRLRLDPTIDVTTLGLSPLGTAIAKAAQKYGFIITDKAGSVAVIAEGGKRGQVLSSDNVDPWNQILADVQPHDVLKGFPWDKVQVIQKDWGKPA